jgi:hypothetical protein
MKLLHKLKWKGYGIYWAIIEILRDTKDYKLEKDYENLSKTLKISEKYFISVIEDFNLFDFDEKYFWSIDLNEYMNIMSAKSEKARVSASYRWSNESRGGMSGLGDILRARR